jgi:glycine oxidase
MTDRSHDAIVVGGGVIGCAIARELARRGAAVIVLERRVPGYEATWAAGGMLSPLSEASHRDPLFVAAVSSLDRWPRFASELAAESGIDVEYRPAGKLLIAFDQDSESSLLEVRARASGFGTQLLDANEAHAVEPVISPEVRAALLIGRDHRVNNRLLGEAVWKAAESRGAEFRLGVEVAGITLTSGPRRRFAAVLLGDGTRIEAGAVVIAAGAWSGHIDGLPRRIPVEPVRGQMFAVDASAWFPGHRPFLEHTIDGPGCYLIPRDNGRIVVGATAERAGFAPGPTPRGLERLLAAAVRTAPAIADLPVVESWAPIPTSMAFTTPPAISATACCLPRSPRRFWERSCRPNNRRSHSTRSGPIASAADRDT